jgi:hypothetical protein
VLNRILSALAAFSIIVAPISTWAAAENDSPMPSSGGRDYPVIDRENFSGQPKIELAQLLLGATNAVGAILAGTPTAFAITSATWVALPGSPTDLPLTQFVDGYTGDLTLFSTAPTGSTGSYAFGTAGSYKFTLPDTWPGYNTSGTFSTSRGTDTRNATIWLRPAYANGANPTEAANGGNAKIALVLDDAVFQSDATGPAVALSGLYGSSVAAASIPVTNNSTKPYMTGIGNWVTDPQQNTESGDTYTAEFFGGHFYGRSGQPFAAVTFQFCDDSACTHSVTKTVSGMTQSTKQQTTTGTATNGSSDITGIGAIGKWIVGQRVTVAGVPGQPKIRALSSAAGGTMSLGVVEASCTTTLNSGVVSISGTPGSGEALDDGGFIGATITDANFTTPAGVATITTEPVAADVTYTSGKATTVKATTGATGVTAAAAHACTINHVYQGSTGTVTIYAGVPTPVYSASLSPSDRTGASFATGQMGHVRLKALPWRGDVVLDSQLGANGDGNDWQGAAFLASGVDVSPNFHNLAFYIDNGKYSPVYAWVSGAAGGSPAIQTSTSDPGASAYYASVSTAVTALKAYNNTGGNRPAGVHNDGNGGVICVIGSITGNGADVHANFVQNVPGLRVTQGVSGGVCGGDADPTAATYNGIATSNFQSFAFNTKFDHITLKGPNTFARGEDSQTIAFGSGLKLSWDYSFDHVVMDSSTGGGQQLLQIGAWQIYNSVVIGFGGSIDGNMLSMGGAQTGGPGVVAFNSIIGGDYTTKRVTWNTSVDLGNIDWGAQPIVQPGAEITSYGMQMQSVVVSFNKLLGLASVSVDNQRGLQRNILFANNVIETINNASGTVPAFWMSGDGANSPAYNWIIANNTVTGGRVNRSYIEGVPSCASASVCAALTTGGALAAAKYQVQVNFALIGNPSVQSSTDGPPATGLTVASGTTGSITVKLPFDPNYVADIFCDTSGDGVVPTHVATIGGVDASQISLAHGANLVITACTSTGLTNTLTNTATNVGHNEPKIDWRIWANLTDNWNFKRDYYNASGSVHNGGRVGAYPEQYAIGQNGNLMQQGTVVGTCSPTLDSGLGDILGTLDKFGVACPQGVGSLSLITYSAYRGWGGQAAAATAPATNIGQGNYCPSSSTNVSSRVPLNGQHYPTDMLGNARDETGVGWAGAYESGCK